MSPRRIGVIFALVVFLAGGDAVAEPTRPCTPTEPCHLRMREDTTLRKDNGTEYLLPPGRFFDEPTWEMLDQELKRLQDQERRLGAENKSLRDSLGGWRPGWITVTSFLLLGVAAGASGYYYWTH